MVNCSKCLTQGMACAPRIFTKVMKPIVPRSRSREFISTYYLDAILLFGTDYQSCLENVKHTEKQSFECWFHYTS